MRAAWKRAKAWNEIPEGLRRPGRRLTDQRRLILEVVRSTRVHPTAEWVHRKVRRRLPRISLGTVYRNLRLLVEEGLIRELDSRMHGRYDGNMMRHHHFTCRACGEIFDLAVPFDRMLDRRMAARTGLEISDHRIEFYGCCLACRARETRRPRAGTPGGQSR
ncbi:MAG: transcriptional repressor [Candidatus Methylomirabilia bacterium]